MRRTLALLAALGAAAGLALAGCSSGGGRTEPDTIVQTAPTPRSSGRDQCGASELAYLVGHAKSDIPVPVNPNLRRVACTTCPVTMDYSPARLNIFFDAETGVIKEVKCG